MGMKGQINESEVLRRLELCTDVAIGDELYQFGERLLTYRIDISHRLDSKASAMAGYSGAILTLLIASYGNWINIAGRDAFAAIMLAGTFAFIAAALAVFAMALRKFTWFTQNEWLKEECIEHPEKLKGYRVLTLWGVLSSYENICARKAAWLRFAQYALMASGFLLLFALLQIAGLYTVCGNLLTISWR